LIVPVAAGLLGCPTSTSSTLVFTPITGIQIDSAQLVAGFGCGTGPGQVFQYAAVVSFAPLGPDGGVESDGDAGPLEVVTSGVFDCFANGILSNLPVSEAGSSAYTLQIFAFNEASFPPQLACAPGPGGPQGVSCPGDDAGAVIPFEPRATFTATCTATQVPGVTVHAICTPLEPRGSVDAGAFEDAPGEDGSSDSGSAEASADGAADGGAGDASGE
jgi:hypothetical protein